MTAFDKAFEEVQILVNKFSSNVKHYMSAGYSEFDARNEFIDPFFIALGWDVNHKIQTNPYEQEVKFEKSQKQQNESARKRADYAFYLAPNHKDEVFFVEAKKPSVLITRNEQHYFQTIRYGWNAGCPISVLTDFEEFVIVDCRATPNIKYALNGQHKVYKYTDYTNKEKFAEIYWVFSREAVANKSIEKYAATLGKAKGKATQKALFKGGYQTIDDSFLEYIDGIRLNLAQAFKKNDDSLDGEQLTEAVQRTVDRLVFIRFLEDKFIEAEQHVNEWTGWKDFIADCRKLDAKYNGVVFKKHFIDEQDFAGAEEKLFVDICQDISSLNSPYDFNYIPIHILGSIYERFLGKVIRTTAKRVVVEEKPEVRKAGGVYYTPKYIVDYIVQNTVGKQIAGKTPKQIAELHFADIACGSGSFLIGVYDCLLDYHRKYYLDKYADKTYKVSENLIGLDKRNEDYGNIEYINNQWTLTLKLKQEILLNNIYGVDIDYQAVEVTQLSLFLKMLEDESLSSIATRQGRLFAKVLPDLTKNIVCGNSLIGYDIISMNGGLFEDAELKKLNPMDYAAAFPKIMRNGGFDAIVGNPPYLSTKRGFAENAIENMYLKQNFKTATKQFDAYSIFIERALNKIKENGIWGFIIPKPFLSNENMSVPRELIIEKGQLTHIADVGTPFKDANVEAVVLIESKNNSQTKNKEIIVHFYNGDLVINERVIDQSIFKNTQHNSFSINSGKQENKILNKIEKGKGTLQSFTKQFTRGIEAGKKDEAITLKATKRTKKLLRGEDVKRYEINFKEVFIEVDDNNVSKFKSTMLYERKKKILIRRVGSELQATIDYDSYWNLNTIYNLILEEEFYEYITGIFNSKLISFWFKNRFLFEDKLFPYARISQLEQIPIPQINFKNPQQKQQHDSIVNCVTQLLAAKQKQSQAKEGRDKEFITNQCNALDTQIDNLVYELYGLTNEEIKIVEGG